MRIDILTLLPELLDSPLNHSIIKRAKDKGLVDVVVHNLRKWSKDKRHFKVDDYAFGFSAGMVMQIEPIFLAIEELKSERRYDEVIFMSPDGEKFDQKTANALSLKENIIILCGHYKGVDYRVRQHLVDMEISVGDSALSDSFQDGLLAPPVYTRPAEYNGWQVPPVLLSGNEAKIHDWEYEQALLRTQRLRPDLL